MELRERTAWRDRLTALKSRLEAGTAARDPKCRSPRVVGCRHLAGLGEVCDDCVMSFYRSQVHLDAGVEEVWALVGNPGTYPQWWPIAVEIRGETFEVGDVYTQVLATFAGRSLEYTRMIDRRDEFKELRWSCPTTGGFQHWLLTAAQGGTFVDMEMGLEPPALRYQLFDKTVGRHFVKRWAEQAIDGLRETLAVAQTPAIRGPAHAPPGVETPPQAG